MKLFILALTVIGCLAGCSAIAPTQPVPAGVETSPTTRCMSAIAAQDWDATVQLANLVMASDPTMAHIQRGYANTHKGEIDEAMEDFNEALRLHPDDVFLLVSRGHCWFNKKEYEKAVQDYTKALDVDPNCSIALASRIRAYVMMGEVEKALPDDAQLKRQGKSNYYRLER
jgi:tetratricopeptide (TPR) repeat protein